MGTLAPPSPMPGRAAPAPGPASPRAALPALRARFDQPIPVGNEGAGVVVAAGAAPAAQRLLGRPVAVSGGGMYQQYRAVPASACLVLDEGTTPAEAASSFVNPMTALAMVETMRREGHTALVHTAAAATGEKYLVNPTRDAVRVGSVE